MRSAASRSSSEAAALIAGRAAAGPGPGRGGQARGEAQAGGARRRARQEDPGAARLDDQGADAQRRGELRIEGRRWRRTTSDSASETTVAAPAAGGKKVTSKTYTFGAMDVEGKLKTPQLLYFLNRVKLELDMSAPDKRSFMKELQQSADDKNL